MFTKTFYKKRTGVFVIILLCLTMLNGCGLPVPSHGNFCGPDYPNIPDGSKEEQIDALFAITPADDLDVACRIHDMCYVTLGYFDRNCDNLFYKYLLQMDFKYIDKYQRDHCSLFKQKVLAYGRSLNMQFIDLGDSAPQLIDDINSGIMRILGGVEAIISFTELTAFNALGQGVEVLGVSEGMTCNSRRYIDWYGLNY